MKVYLPNGSIGTFPCINLDPRLLQRSHFLLNLNFTFRIPMIFKVVVVAVGTRITALAIIYATCTNFSYTSLMYFSVQIQISKSHSISAVMSFFKTNHKFCVMEFGTAWSG